MAEPAPAAAEIPQADKGAVPGFDRRQALATDEDFNKFIATCEETDNGWEEQYKTETLTLWRKISAESAINIVKIRSFFTDVEPDTLYDVLHDHYFRRSWDDHMIEGSIVEQIDGFNEVGYYSVKMPMPLSSRDFCNHRAWRVFPDRGIWVIFNRSVAHPGCPEVSGFQRGWSYLSGYMLKRREGGGTDLFYYTQNDPRGWIPGWLINWVSTKLTPKLIDTVHTNALKYPEWKAKNKPEWKPWLSGYNPAEEPYCRHACKKK
eukprot:m51a1_g188 hypothetical protein (262) ;mRNA; r:605815-606798